MRRIRIRNRKRTIIRTFWPIGDMLSLLDIIRDCFILDVATLKQVLRHCELSLRLGSLQIQQVSSVFLLRLGWWFSRNTVTATERISGKELPTVFTRMASWAQAGSLTADALVSTILPCWGRFSLCQTLLQHKAFAKNNLHNQPKLGTTGRVAASKLFIDTGPQNECAKTAGHKQMNI